MKNIQDNNWVSNWQAKNDYLEKVLSNNKNEIIEETKDYYIGLAETAIFIAKRSKTLNKKVICHKRINMNNDDNRILDYKEREYGEYIKYLLFHKEKRIEYLKEYVDKNIKSNLSKELIMARILYPSEYFDLIDNYYKGIDINNDIYKLKKKKKLRSEIVSYINKKRG